MIAAMASRKLTDIFGQQVSVEDVERWAKSSAVMQWISAAAGQQIGFTDSFILTHPMRIHIDKTEALTFPRYLWI